MNEYTIITNSSGEKGKDHTQFTNAWRGSVSMWDGQGILALD